MQFREDRLPIPTRRTLEHGLGVYEGFEKEVCMGTVKDRYDCTREMDLAGGGIRIRHQHDWTTIMAWLRL